MHRFPAWLAAFAIFTCVNHSAIGQTYNAATQFSAASNPNGVWSYGYSISQGSSFLPFPDGGSSSGAEFWRNDSILVLGAPVLYHFSNDSSAIFHPGNLNERTIFRFTAPEASYFAIESSYYGISNATSDIFVLKNGTGSPLFSAEVNGSGSGSAIIYNSVVPLNMGDTLDFGVGFGNNDNYGSDSTVITLAITTTPVPEPAGLLVISAFALCYHRRNRRTCCPDA